MTIDFLSAFIVGVLGSGHCLAMCGGVSTMLTSSIGVNQQHTKPWLVLCYHFGRISSYSLIGAIVGYSGSVAAKNIGVPLAGLRLVAALFLILLGLYLGQWLMWLTKIETVGRHLWRFISPLAKLVIPVTSPTKALLLGTIWGWLPCGLVYSTLTWSLASGSALTGAGIMLFFGLGTIPALTALSLSITSIPALIKHPLMKKIFAICLISYGVYSAKIAYSLLF